MSGFYAAIHWFQRFNTLFLKLRISSFLPAILCLSGRQLQAPCSQSPSDCLIDQWTTTFNDWLQGIWPHSPRGSAPWKFVAPLGKHWFLVTFSKRDQRRQHSKQHLYIISYIDWSRVGTCLQHSLNISLPKKLGRSKGQQSTLVPAFLCLYPWYHFIMMEEVLHQLIGILSQYLQGWYIPGGAGFLPATVSFPKICWSCSSRVFQSLHLGDVHCSYQPAIFKTSSYEKWYWTNLSKQCTYTFLAASTSNPIPLNNGVFFLQLTRI